jgi:hypothetical protein
VSLESKQSDLIIEIESAIKGFNKGIPGIQQQIYKDILNALKELDVKGGTIQNNAKNINLIRGLQKKIEKAVLSDKYVKDVKDFIKSFTTVSKIQNDYFKLIEKGWKPFDALQEVKFLSIQSTTKSLTESGINANVISKIEDLLLTNITSAVKFTDMVENMRSFIIGNDKVDGALVKYVKQITIDSLNQYSASYNKMVSDDLGLEWYMYTGSNIRTTRCFCLAMTKKKFVHVSELKKIVSGDFQEFQEMDCTIYSKTGLPQGMIEGTDENNITVRRGGYSCGHQMPAVSSAIVPENIRAKFE